MTRLEHANITVADIDATIAFLRAVDPDFTVRYDQVSERGYRWAHVTVGESYIALQEPHVGSKPALNPPYTNYGVNHLAWVVDDLEAVCRRLRVGGYREGLQVEPHAHRLRAYFYDADGFEWELVQYTSDDAAERHALG